MDIVKLFHMCFFMHIYCFHIYLNSIVTVVMMLLCSLISRECHAHNVVKFLIAKNVECKFYKHFWLEQYCM